MTTTAEGSLYELVSRGNKDVYFFQDLPDSKYLFDNKYKPFTPSLADLRVLQPISTVDFGRQITFDLQVIGDILTQPTFLITLPTWLPPTYAALNRKSITSSSGVRYGYTNGIAYFLFEQIQVFQDNILLQEFSGDYLWASTKIKGKYSDMGITNELTGTHDESSLGISRNATPPTLRLELPLIGCQNSEDPGFPQRAVTKHSFRIKCRLRKLQDLIEASDNHPTNVKPSPFNIPFTQETSTGISTFTSLTKDQMSPLLIQLETRQVYIEKEDQNRFCSDQQRILFRRVYENVFNQTSSDYIAVKGGGVSAVNRRLDGRHPSDRILWFFRTNQDIFMNRLWKLYQGYSDLSLTIAGQTRELPRNSLVWRDITNFAKEELDTGSELNTMNWGLGSIAEKRFSDLKLQAQGSVNMTTADRPTFYISLADVPSSQPAETELRVFTEGYSIFQTDGNGRAELFSMN